MSTIMTASHQWATRPDDERFTSLFTMRDHFEALRANSRSRVVSTRSVEIRPVGEDHKQLQVFGPQGNGFAPTHWAFGQYAQLAESPAGYLRTLPAEMAADCINWKMSRRPVEDIGLLLYKNGEAILRAATGPKYGRVWNSDVTNALIHNFGDGVTGDWRVPGEFGKAVDVDQRNTTLYASDRDMFTFLADEKNRIEIPNRRAGQKGTLARGFFCWNSEVGDKTFGLGTFLFDYVCCNRIVWGAEDYVEFKMRHTVSAPDRFFEEIQPALQTYRNRSASTMVDAISAARQARIGDPEAVTEFLANRFGKRLVSTLQSVHRLEEDRPIETLWDASTAATAYARGITHQNDRVAIERQAGEILKLVMPQKIAA